MYTIWFFWIYTLTTWLFSWNLSGGVGTPGGIDSEMIDSARDRDIILLLSWLLSSKSHLIRIRVRALAHRISVSIIVHKTPAKVDSEFSFFSLSTKTTFSIYYSRGNRIDVSSRSSTSVFRSFENSIMCNGASLIEIGPKLMVVSLESCIERRFRRLIPPAFLTVSSKSIHTALYIERVSMKWSKPDSWAIYLAVFQIAKTNAHITVKMNWSTILKFE